MGNGGKHPRGCPGAVYSGGNPSHGYCNGQNGQFPWWNKCCKFSGGKCIPNGKISGFLELGSGSETESHAEASTKCALQVHEQIRQRVAMTSFLQLNNEPTLSNKAALVVATGDLDDWRRRMNEETKDLKQVSEQCNVDTGKRYKEDLEAATDVFEEALRKAKAASKEDETTNNEAYDARKKALSEDKEFLDSILQSSRHRAKAADEQHASARATLVKAEQEQNSALSEAAKKRDEARSEADTEHASATADDKEESSKIRSDAQKSWDDTRPIKQTKCSDQEKTLEAEAILLRKIRHKLDEIKTAFDESVDVDVDLMLDKLKTEQTDNEEEFEQCTSAAKKKKKSTKEKAQRNDDTEQDRAKSQRKTDAMQEQKQFDEKTNSWNERTQKA